MDVDALDSNGWTPLHTACLHGGGNRRAVVELLLDYGADIDKSTAGSRRAPLLLAATAAVETSGSEDVELVKLLLRRGASMELVDSSGLTPLLATAMCGRPLCLTFLLSVGANVHAVVTGCNGLHLAINGTSKQHRECVKLLSKWDAEISLLKSQANKRGHVPSASVPPKRATFNNKVKVNSVYSVYPRLCMIVFLLFIQLPTHLGVFANSVGVCA